MSWRAHALVVAAGEGLRMGGDRPKQFLEVAGRPLLSHALIAFESHPRIETITLVLPAGQLAEGDRLRSDYGVNKLHPAVEGGARRRDSVRAGLDTIVAAETGSSDLLVAVHDGARPVLHLDLLDRLLESAAEHGAAIPVVPVRDTVVESAEGDTLGEGVDRRRLRSVQTPQVFRSDWLLEAHDTFGEADATDDAGMVLAAGHPVRLVAGDAMNIKVTDPGDLELVTRILAGEVNER